MNWRYMLIIYRCFAGWLVTLILLTEKEEYFSFIRLVSLLIVETIVVLFPFKFFSSCLFKEVSYGFSSWTFYGQT